jgi:class 3 adenylate cyclase
MQDDEYVRFGHGAYLAEHIEGARLVTLPGADHWPTPQDAGLIEEFVTGSRSDGADADRALATVLFVDVVGSTEHAHVVGDRSWTIARDQFRETARSALGAYEGRLEDTAGDGLLATFDGPARAVRCASRMVADVRRSGLEVRCGLHAGEVTRSSSGVAGIAVHIGARVSALARPSEILVTRTVRDLVAGSGLAFENRGEHELKGVPDTWALYAVEQA